MATKKATKPEKKSGWVFPIASKRQTQGFSGAHGGRDYGVASGSTLVSPTGGKVVFAGKDSSGYGNLIKIQTNDGKTVYLAHLSEIDVRTGQKVDAGQFIGKTGNTGNSTGPHLHYEIRAGTKKIDPLTFYQDGTSFTVNYPKTTSKGKPQAEQVQAAAERSLSAEVTPVNLIQDWLGGLNWGNVIAAVVGILLIVVGVMGLVTTEAARTALQPLTETLQGQG